MTTGLLLAVCAVLCAGLAVVAVVAHRRSRAVGVLSARVEQSQDLERQRLALVLHDDIGQKLALLKLQLQMASGADQGGTSLDEAIGVVDGLIADIRSMSSTLKPVPFEPGALVPALRILAQREAARAGLAILVDVADEPLVLPRDVELACYPVVREALANVVKHAGARHVAVILTRTAHALVMRVEDDGRGFDVKHERRRADTGGHLGLRGVEERLAAVGGRLDLQSAVGVGTTIECVIPLGTS